MSRGAHLLSWLGVLIRTGAVYGQDNPHKVLTLDCQYCHISASWSQINFDHKSTGFNLEGGHSGLKCISCHSLENFEIADKGCAACHPDVHQGKLYRSCQRCHTPTAWSVIDVTIAHAGTTFPLIGRHAAIDCRSCHISDIEGEFSFLRSECISCHRAEFSSARNPSHTALGFGTRCDECHTMLSWQPADFSRHNSFFPIYSGAHAGRWSSCFDCHPVIGDYSVFTCIICHAHSQPEMDSRHQEVGGYVYSSDACYRCHPSGSGGG